MITFSLIVGYLFVGTMGIALVSPLIFAFMLDWKRAILMVLMFAMIAFLAVGVAVLVNVFAAIVFAGSFTGWTIGACWDEKDTSIFSVENKFK